MTEHVILCDQRQRITQSIAIKLLVALSLYSLLLVFDLVNKYDAIGYGNYFLDGDGELSSGRWMIRYFDSFHFGISPNPIISILSICFFVFSTYFLSNVFNIKVGSIHDYALSFLFLSNTAICSILSYRYTSTSYAFAFLLSTLCIWLILKASACINTKHSRILFYLITSALCLAVLSGIYQTFISCVGLIGLCVLIRMLIHGDSPSAIKRYILSGFIVAITGELLYFLILKFELWRYNVQLSNYKNVGSISLPFILSNLIPSLKTAFTDFISYFKGTSFHWNIWVERYLSRRNLLFVLFLMGSVFVTQLLHVYKRNKLHALGVVLCLVFFPAIANLSEILSPGSGLLIQQTVPEALSLAAFYAVITAFWEFRPQKWVPAKNIISFAAALLLIWGSAFATIRDQIAMREGLQSMESISQAVVSQLISDDFPFYDENIRIVTIGDIEDNPLFSTSALYSQANSYARVAKHDWENFDIVASTGTFRHRLGLNITTSSNKEFLSNPLVQKMPIFPQKGSIQQFGDTIVIKYSNPTPIGNSTIVVESICE